MADNGDGETAGHEGSSDGRPALERKTEWTASDARGPLNAADPETGPVADPIPAAAADVGPTDPETAAASEPSSPAEPVSSAPPASIGAPARRPVLPILAALVVGALIGAGSAALVYQYEQGNSGADTQVAALGARIDALEKRPDPSSSIDALKQSVASLNSKVEAAQTAAGDAHQSFDPAPLQKKLGDLQSKLDALQQKSSNANDLDGKLAGLSSSVDELKTTTDGFKATTQGLKTDVAGLNDAVAGLKKEDAATQSSLASLQTGQKQLESKISSSPALAVAAGSLVEAIGQGQPYASQVDALASLGADPAKLAVLRENADKGVPTAQTLAAKFTPLADPILATTYKAAPNAGLMDRLKSGMMSMVSVRRAGAPVGDDVGSRVSRIQSDLDHDDIAGAYAVWEGLPADAKAKSDAWGALAKTQVEAMSAARALQQQAIATLGAKKS